MDISGICGHGFPRRCRTGPLQLIRAPWRRSRGVCESPGQAEPAPVFLPAGLGLRGLANWSRRRAALPGPVGRRQRQAAVVGNVTPSRQPVAQFDPDRCQLDRTLRCRRRRGRLFPAASSRGARRAPARRAGAPNPAARAGRPGALPSPAASTLTPRPAPSAFRRARRPDPAHTPLPRCPRSAPSPSPPVDPSQTPTAVHGSPEAIPARRFRGAATRRGSPVSRSSSARARRLYSAGDRKRSDLPRR